MSLGIFLGYGADVELLLSERHNLPPDATLFRVNVRGLSSDPDGLELVNPIAIQRQIADLKDRGIKTVVAVGSMKLQISGSNKLLQSGGTFLELIELLKHLPKRSSSSDDGRRYIYSKVASDFHFPKLIDVLPCLFAPTDVSVGRRDDLCAKALADPTSYRRDATVQVDGLKVKVFRVGSEVSNNIITRRLYPGKLKKYHETEEINHFFFDKNRTTVVSLDEMESYARTERLTLQSFTDGN